MHKLCTSHVQHTAQMGYTRYSENEDGSGLKATATLKFIDFYYDPSVACNCRLYIAYVQLMYGPGIAYV